jgi:hypothetical protein
MDIFLQFIFYVFVGQHNKLKRYLKQHIRFPDGDLCWNMRAIIFKHFCLVPLSCGSMISLIGGAPRKMLIHKLHETDCEAADCINVL